MLLHPRFPVRMRQGDRQVRDGGLAAIDADPLRRARELERLGFLRMTLQQPLGLDFQAQLIS